MIERDAKVELTHLQRIASAQAEQPDLEAFLDLTADVAARTIGHRLFTIMAFHEQNMEVERLYSNQPDSYPTGGRKQKRDTAWGRKVLERGEPFIGTSAADIRQHFKDHELILGLGLESILNMPIKLGGKTIGTMNLLHEADYYSAEDQSSAQLIAGLIAGRLVRLKFD